MREWAFLIHILSFRSPCVPRSWKSRLHLSPTTYVQHLSRTNSYHSHFIFRSPSSAVFGHTRRVKSAAYLIFLVGPFTRNFIVYIATRRCPYSVRLSSLLSVPFLSSERSKTRRSEDGKRISVNGTRKRAVRTGAKASFVFRYYFIKKRRILDTF